jgi:ParB/RepB/Spo0J family partition protein
MIDNLDELAGSIAELGVLQPVLLTSVEEWLEKYPEDSAEVGAFTWVIQDGHRRNAAARQAGVAAVPFVQRGVDVDETVLRIATAYHSLRLTPIEEALNFRYLVDERRMTQTQIALQTGVSQGYISNRLKMLTLPDPVQDAVSRGAVAVDAALKLGREADTDTVARVGAKIDHQLNPDPVLDEVTGEEYVPDITPVDLPRIINEVNEERRAEEAHQIAQASAAELEAEFAPVIADRFPGTDRAHRITSQTDIQRAAAKSNLIVAPGKIGVEPEYYLAELERRSYGEQQSDREERLRKEAAAGRMDAIRRAAGQTIPASVLQETLVKITISGLGLTTSKASMLAYEIATHAGLAERGFGDWTWRASLPSLSASDQVKTAWIVALASIELVTGAAKTPWGPLQQWYFTTLDRLVGYKPTEWEQSRLDALRKDHR